MLVLTYQLTCKLPERLQCRMDLISVHMLEEWRKSGCHSPNNNWKIVWNSTRRDAYSFLSCCCCAGIGDPCPQHSGT